MYNLWISASGPHGLLVQRTRNERDWPDFERGAHHNEQVRLEGRGEEGGRGGGGGGGGGGGTPEHQHQCSTLTRA